MTNLSDQIGEDTRPVEAGLCFFSSHHDSGRDIELLRGRRGALIVPETMQWRCMMTYTSRMFRTVQQLGIHVRLLIDGSLRGTQDSLQETVPFL